MTITIDIGTTAVKVLHFNQDNKQIGTQSLGYDTLYPAEGYAEQNPAHILEAVHKCLTQIKVSGEEILVLSCAMHSLMAVDHAMQPLTNLWIWADHRADQVMRTFKKSAVATQFFQKTGTPLHPMSPFAKLLWLKETAAGNSLRQELTDFYKWIDIKTYLWYALTGYIEQDVSMASATGLVNTELLVYDTDVLSYLGISAQQLPELVSVYTCRRLTSMLTATTGITGQAMIGASDGVLANISESRNTGDAHLTIGTSGAIRVTTKEAYKDPFGQLFCYYLDDTTWVVGGAVNNGGNVFKWLDQLLYDGQGELFQQLKTIDFTTFDSSLVFVPHLNGERAPFWDSERQGAFFGLKINHDKIDVIKAVVYGVLFNLRHVYQTLTNLTGPIKSLYLSGGTFKIPQLAACVANCLHVQVILSETLEQSSVGALNLVSDYEHNKRYTTLKDDEKQREAIDAYYSLYQAYLPLAKRKG